ncbi:MAG: hypothetical protein U0872_07135 [Planctomycetaceae bacterium]
MVRNVLSAVCSAAGLACVVLSLENVVLAVPAPEIDAGSAVTALSVLGAGWLMLRDRLKK